MKLVYLSEADKDLDLLYDFLINNATHLKTADKALLRIRQGVNALVDHPELGISLGDGTERRELSLNFGTGAYIIRHVPDYKYKEILILRIWHSKEARD